MWETLRENEPSLLRVSSMLFSVALSQIVSFETQCYEFEIVFSLHRVLTLPVLFFENRVKH